MTVIDRLRTSRQPARDTAPTREEPASPARFAAGGGLTATASALVGLVLALLGRASTDQSTVAPRMALGIGADAWLLAHGARIGVGAAFLAFTPLLWWALVVWLVAVGAGWLLRTVPPAGPRWLGLFPRALPVRLVAFAGGYAAIAAVVGMLTGPVAARPVAATAGPAVLLTVAIGLAVALTRDASRRGGSPPWRLLAVPKTIRRAVPSALWGAAVLLAVGAGVVVLQVLVHFGSVRHVGHELVPGTEGAVLLWVGQALYLPNLALWAVSFVAGSGFEVVSGAGTTWSGAQTGLMPMVPVFAALPAPGRFPAWLPDVVLLPVAVGSLVGRRVVRSVTRLAGLWTKATVAVTAAVGTALLLGALDGLAGGSLGAARLSDIGAPAVTMALLLAVELTVGAVGFVLWDRWRLHRR